MRKPGVSDQQREKIFERIDRKNVLDARRRRLYNRKYRKTPLYVLARALRLLSMLFFLCVLLFNEKSGSYREERVLENDSEVYYKRVTGRYSSGEKRKVTIISVSTDDGNYSSDFGTSSVPAFKVGDTLLVERNIFNKPIYFSKKGWNLAYSIRTYAEWYVVTFLVVLISLFFSDGLDRFTDKIIWVGWTLSLVALYCYFFT